MQLQLIFSYIIERNGQDVVALREKGTILENMFNRVKEISETDELTQTYNRRKIKEIMNLLLTNYQTTNIPFSILLIDIDRFKKINDTYGHQKGDEVLKHVTVVLDHVTRDADFLGRWGGDEFIIVLSNTTYENCKIVKSKIQHTYKTYKNKGLSIPVDLSIGCAQSTADLTYEEIIHQADVDLYHEKDIKLLVVYLEKQLLSSEFK